MAFAHASPDLDYFRVQSGSIPSVRLSPTIDCRLDWHKGEIQFRGATWWNRIRTDNADS